MSQNIDELMTGIKDNSDKKETQVCSEVALHRLN